MAVTDSYLPGPRTTPSRSLDRARYDRETVHRVLDEAYICHLGFVADGEPVVLPTIHARVGDTLYLHGSTGSRPLLLAGANLRVCVTVTLHDGLVLARSAFHHSMNYRSVMAHGVAELVRDPEEKLRALEALVDSVVPGRFADCRQPTAKELAATAVLRLELAEVSAKVRTGGPKEDEEDLDLPYWAGVVPLSQVPGEPEPDEYVRPGSAPPAYLPGNGTAAEGLPVSSAPRGGA
jgi:nitroimidazol reductase NimA-like FMN-containing flavoprotein (pyridoxamine 5'-phosphate oxidase superfamily)